MKFLENEKLIELTGQLSEAALGRSHRIINGRIEAYTMKRAGNDKKFAHTLGQKFIADLEEQQQLLNDLTQVHASRKAADTAVLSGLNNSSGSGNSSEKPTTTTTTTQGRKRSNSATSFLEAVSKKKPKTLNGRRTRSHSVDVTFHNNNSSNSNSNHNNNKSTLGDISELATRRLMTDLILTLNASFPDYDFSNAKPQQFEKWSLPKVQRSISERLSELATLRKLQGGGGKAELLLSPNSNDNDLVVDIFSALDGVVNLKECDIYAFEDESFLDESDHLWSFHYFFVNKSLRRLVFFTCSEHIDIMSSEETLEETEHEVMMPSEMTMLENTEYDYSSNMQEDAVFSGSGGMSVPIYSIH